MTDLVMNSENGGVYKIVYNLYVIYDNSCLMSNIDFEIGALCPKFEDIRLFWGKISICIYSICMLYMIKNGHKAKFQIQIWQGSYVSYGIILFGEVRALCPL